MSITVATTIRQPVGTSIRTTLPIPVEHLREIDRLVREGAYASRSAVVASALARYFWDLEEAEMFQAFGDAAKDPAWISDAVDLAEEAVGSGWEVVQLGDQDEPA